MTRTGLDSQKDGVSAPLGVLHLRGPLEAVPGYYPVIMVRGRDQRWWVTGATLNVVHGRVRA